ncbi:hypothetical protein ABIF65_000578 [Bradyrhizobium japonicum]
MSRTSKGPRLYKRAARRKNGAIVRNSVWVVLDGSKEISTGVAATPDQSKESWPRLFGQRPAGFKWIPAGLC